MWDWKSSASAFSAIGNVGDSQISSVSTQLRMLSGIPQFSGSNSTPQSTQKDRATSENDERGCVVEDGAFPGHALSIH